MRADARLSIYHGEPVLIIRPGRRPALAAKTIEILHRRNFRIERQNDKTITLKKGITYGESCKELEIDYSLARDEALSELRAEQQAEQSQIEQLFEMFLISV